jgi:hypothetical protein
MLTADQIVDMRPEMAIAATTAVDVPDLLATQQ